MADDTAGSGPVPVTHLFDTILILDFGSQYSHLITRRLREINVYAEMLPCTQKIAELTWKPKGIILSGSPYSVYAEDAPHADPALFDLGVPVLGICYGLCELAWIHGSEAVQAESREYGHAMLRKQTHNSSSSQHIDALFNSLPPEFQVWMSHGDKLLSPPKDFVVIGTTPSAPLAAIAHASKPWYGIQFHPEVTHTPLGAKIITNFATDICHCRQDWKMENFVQREIQRIRDLVGEKGEVVGAVSGGVDSTVAAKLMHEAIGSRFHAILVDNGLLRLNEAKQVHETLMGALGINLAVVDASAEFLGRLNGVEDPEKKRKIIGNTFIEVFEREAEKLDQKSGGKIEWLLQGTLYPDVIESVSFRGPSQTIKTHHNVGGLLEDMKLKLIEPLRELFKDEVRAMGTLLGIPEDLVWRHPFPGPGIGIRILGPVTPELVEIVRQADHIFISEIKKSGYYRKISQALAAVTSCKAVGVMGDQRTYEHVVLLRAIETVDFMTADVFEFPQGWLKAVANKIVNEVRGVNRCCYDITSKPPGTVEFE